ALDAHPEAWFATGKIYRAGQENVLDGTFDAISRAACPWRCGQGRTDGPQWSVPCAIDMAPCTAALFRRELFTRVGLLDQRFESYLEDVDFGLRCVLAGCRGRYVPEATCRHWGSATLGVWNSETVRLLARNQMFLVAKHYPRDWPLRFGWPVLAGQLLWGLVAARHGCARAYLRGKWEGIGRFDSIRADGPRHSSQEGDLLDFLHASERLIGRLQRTGSASPSAVEMDWYWRLYFALT
ncbi:MAG: glycosyltransferase family 2 protein, partial [Acidobacteriia bacterium]|nr:glycosyltransferase family 2 protein [Terriglobia bacterium]